MNDSTRAKFQAITEDLKKKQGTIKELCEKHGMNTTYFYAVRSKQAKFNKKFSPKKSKGPKYVDIPLVQTTTPRDVVIVCTPGALKQVLEQWS